MIIKFKAMLDFFKLIYSIKLFIFQSYISALSVHYNIHMSRCV